MEQELSKWSLTSQSHPLELLLLQRRGDYRGRWKLLTIVIDCSWTQGAIISTLTDLALMSLDGTCWMPNERSLQTRLSLGHEAFFVGQISGLNWALINYKLLRDDDLVGRICIQRLVLLQGVCDVSKATDLTLTQSPAEGGLQHSWVSYVQTGLLMHPFECFVLICHNWRRRGLHVSRARQLALWDFVLIIDNFGCWRAGALETS
jgi:hypothetical protein